MSCDNDKFFDEVYQLPFAVKRPPPETRVFEIPFKNLVSGISSINDITIIAQGKVTEVIALTESNRVILGTSAYFTGTGGTDKEDYIVECNVTDTVNPDNKPTRRVLIKVRLNDYE